MPQWRTKAHPDPDGETFELLVNALDTRWEQFAAYGVSDLGLFFDFASLYQEPRTAEQGDIFGGALKSINLWYAHKLTTVWLITAGVDAHMGYSYWDKGWTSFEYYLAMMIKCSNTSFAASWPQVVDLGRASEQQIYFARPPIVEPLGFYAGHQSGDKVYTNGADRDRIVAPKFKQTVFELLGGLDELDFSALGWGDAELVQLTSVLPLCGRMRTLRLGRNAFTAVGALALSRWLATSTRLEVLELNENFIGGAGASAIGTAMHERCTLRELRLDNNGIDAEGMRAIAAALGASISALATLSLLCNPMGGDGGAVAFAATGASLRRNAALTELNLSCTAIGDVSVTALSPGIAANTTLRCLLLTRSAVGDMGAAALADVLRTNGALTYINLAHNHIGDAGASALADAIRINQTLAHLVLQDNLIGKAGGTAFFGALGAMNALRHLNVDYNNIGEKRGDGGWRNAPLDVLLKALANGSVSLSQLDLENNGLSEEAKEALLRAPRPESLKLTV